jgi:hypothetical protein
MQYVTWFVRLLYAAWMIPAGLNHFIRLYPQPTGSQPLSIEVFTALLDSGLFTVVKAVELIAGFAVLLGFRMPLMLIAVLPVSFTVWYWDTELQGWWTGSAIYGWSVLTCNLFLCLAYWESYKAMFARDVPPQAPLPALDIPSLLDILRIALGVVLVLSALRYFMPFLLAPYMPLPEFADPMALRLRTALDQSGLLAVAKFIHLVGGLMLLTKRSVPFALAAMMPVNVCAMFIAMLEGNLPLILAALVILGVNGLLMLAYLPSYKGVLSGGQLADGEGPEAGRNYESIFVNPMSGAPTRAYLWAAIPLAAALYAYWQVVPGLNGPTGLWTLVLPAAIFAVGLGKSLAKKGEA